ncbi:MAG TPA: Co2+/Mg2+ efflux protein ApaG [Chitinophagaceae bacterium]|nr:Co2+/Mg2+ efflux protein ApaG [Chitinophagaceae bacterium]
MEVSVETFYQPDYSNPVSGEFMYAYRISIENHNVFPVKLLSRYWFIVDSDGSSREVEGDGVVGVQPVIQPGERYQYVSGCNLRTEMGKMYGVYTMENLDTLTKFDVRVPNFEMLAPFKMN